MSDSTSMRARFGDQFADRYETLTVEARQELDRELAGLELVTDAEFVERCEAAIATGALMASSRYSLRFNLATDAMFTESNRRHILDGHQAECRGFTLYDRAHNRVARANFFTPTPPADCTCGPDQHPTATTIESSN